MSTDENGRFTIDNLPAGQHQLALIHKVFINNEFIVGPGAGMRVQDHNSSRSNKTASVISTDGGNNNESNSKGNIGPVKWMAPESIRKSINIGHDNLRNILASLDALEQQLDADRSSDKSIINASRNAIRNHRSSVAGLERSLDELQLKDRETAMTDLDEQASLMNSKFLELQASLAKMGKQYTALSNVLKTRHETAMNAIRNMK